MKMRFFQVTDCKFPERELYFMEVMERNFKKLCRLAGETIVRYRLISDGDRLLVGASGGKDSFMLLHLLDHLKQVAPVKFDFRAATFDPGFPGFGAEITADYCRRRGWEHHNIAVNIPAVIADKKMADNPCMLCSRLRRGNLYRLAGELQCNKLALGQHLDDVISSFLMSMCRGQGLTSMAPLVKPQNPAHPAVIRPLALIPEELISECAKSFDFPEKSGKCAYEKQLKSGDRAYFSDLVKELSRRIPGFYGNAANSLGKVELEHLLIAPGTQD